MEATLLPAVPAISDSGNSNSSSSIWCPESAPAAMAESSPAEVEALRRLSESLLSLLHSPTLSFCSDTTISISSAGPDPDPPREFRAHRCILSARSPFFRDLFASAAPERLELRKLVTGFDVGFEALELVLGYVYSGMVGPLPRGVCECVDEECYHVACWPAVDFVLQVLFLAFTFQITELVSLFQRHILGILEEVAIDDIPMILSVANLCSKACTKLATECNDIVVKSDLDIVTLDKALPPDVVDQIKKSRSYLGLDGTEPNMHVRRIHKALDSHDIELVKMLLKEEHTTLDSAYALHYALAHCNSKITVELLDLGRADVNHKNPRGYTVLHIAAMLKEPEVIVSLLTKGAKPFDLTSDGKKAIQISKRLTKAVDYNRPVEQGKASSKDRLCIEILEQAERSDPLIRETSISVAMAASDLLQKLQYLEARVALAKLLYPMEAKVAMVNAHVDGTLEFTTCPASYLSTGNQLATVVLNETPLNIKEEHISRWKALSKTVELGMRYFPRCAEFLSKLVDDDSSELAYVEQNTSEGRKKRFLELQDEMMKAFLEDKEFDGSVLHPSRSSRRARSKLARK